MGAVFRIQSVELMESEIWRFHLLLTGEEDEELLTLTKRMKKRISSYIKLGSIDD